MDITQSIAPKSDQLNYEDVALTGPVTVTVAKVTAGNAEQPVHIHLEEFPGRPFKPSKTSRRTIVAGWGPETSVYVGRRMTLFGDPTVKWAGKAVGGIRVSHLSHIEKPITLALTETRGQRKTHTVQPLPDAPAPQQASPEPTAEQVAACTSVDDLRAMWNVSGPERRAQIEARRDEITGGGEQA
ncbi:hypothetical protein [Aeromicrobium sp. HA]|uniref:hypothetical protein n=1 Tax=Aeromicrobium sp. HA TaxID=3009077 RepID=UPI0022AEAB7B|nr:hypothetical protein [Aeromicrobium sp. HA]